MDRRAFLRLVTAVSAGSFAGCFDDSTGTGGDDDEPIREHPEALLLTAEAFDESAWAVDDVETADDTASTSFVNPETSEGIVAQVWVYETVEDAKEEYQRRYDEISDDWSTRTVNVGVEGFAYQGAVSSVIFRDANVVGEVFHFVEYTDGRIADASEYASRMHARW